MEKKYFAYLDSLRESGEVNMFGAAPYLAKKFGLGRVEAREIVYKWIDQFSGQTRKLFIYTENGVRKHVFK